jgi:hypothetical protein
MMMLVRPFAFAGAAFVIGVLVAYARAAWRTAPLRQRYVAAALLGVVGFTAARIVPEYWSAESDRAIGEANKYTSDREGAAQLETWAAGEMAKMTPGTWGRALFMSDAHDHMHLTARTGLPSFHLSPIPDLLLRERIEDLSPESLARFNVRWVVTTASEPGLGDEATEKRFGTYHVREINEWDGKLARVERGEGTVVTTRIEQDLVEINVTANAPVLVALGMGYYPRWRARHETGVAEPVYATPTIKDGKLHVVSAWVAPGRTVFTCDGPLPVPLSCSVPNGSGTTGCNAKQIITEMTRDNRPASRFNFVDYRLCCRIGIGPAASDHHARRHRCHLLQRLAARSRSKLDLRRSRAYAAFTPS